MSPCPAPQDGGASTSGSSHPLDESWRREDYSFCQDDDQVCTADRPPHLSLTPPPPEHVRLPPPHWTPSHRQFQWMQRLFLFHPQDLMEIRRQPFSIEEDSKTRRRRLRKLIKQVPTWLLPHCSCPAAPPRKLRKRSVSWDLEGLPEGQEDQWKLPRRVLRKMAEQVPLENNEDPGRIVLSLTVLWKVLQSPTLAVQACIGLQKYRRLDDLQVVHRLLPAHDGELYEHLLPVEHLLPHMDDILHPWVSSWMVTEWTQTPEQFPLLLRLWDVLLLSSKENNDIHQSMSAVVVALLLEFRSLLISESQPVLLQAKLKQLPRRMEAVLLERILWQSQRMVLPQPEVYDDRSETLVDESEVEDDEIPYPLLDQRPEEWLPESSPTLPEPPIEEEEEEEEEEFNTPTPDIKTPPISVLEQIQQRLQAENTRRRQRIFSKSKDTCRASTSAMWNPQDVSVPVSFSPKQSSILPLTTKEMHSRLKAISAAVPELEASPHPLHTVESNSSIEDANTLEEQAPPEESLETSETQKPRSIVRQDDSSSLLDRLASSDVWHLAGIFLLTTWLFWWIVLGGQQAVPFQDDHSWTTLDSTTPSFRKFQPPVGPDRSSGTADTSLLQVCDKVLREEIFKSPMANWTKPNASSMASPLLPSVQPRSLACMKGKRLEYEDDAEFWINMDEDAAAADISKQEQDVQEFPAAPEPASTQVESIPKPPASWRQGLGRLLSGTLRGFGKAIQVHLDARETAHSSAKEILEPRYEQLQEHGSHLASRSQLVLRQATNTTLNYVDDGGCSSVALQDLQLAMDQSRSTLASGIDQVQDGSQELWEQTSMLAHHSIDHAKKYFAEQLLPLLLRMKAQVESSAKAGLEHGAEVSKVALDEWIAEQHAFQRNVSDRAIWAYHHALDFGSHQQQRASEFLAQQREEWGPRAMSGMEAASETSLKALDLWVQESHDQRDWVVGQAKNGSEEASRILLTSVKPAVEEFSRKSFDTANQAMVRGKRSTVQAARNVKKAIHQQGARYANFVMQREERKLASVTQLEEVLAPMAASSVKLIKSKVKNVASHHGPQMRSLTLKITRHLVTSLQFQARLSHAAHEEALSALQEVSEPVRDVAVEVFWHVTDLLEALQDLPVIGLAIELFLHFTDLLEGLARALFLFV
eukprot:CAMPEP_0176164218 /NCGR_PEP_ID=MMETSP0120_2-20121206/84008_1 /TAXON_ID=160619 /ORGANISM="Kryptoperidinium foliaceum, Strain CCMP 1326" /LENGTH=1152 /DNA_ID=CAMNT_0017501749 /DNA_START=216 /DNA_END=3673 /DNA_ORIENTATION=-